MTDLLFPDLSYNIRGLMFEIRKQYGPGQKEIIYQKIIEEKLKLKKILFEREKKINVVSLDTGKIIGIYRPDFIVDNLVILEIKATEFSTMKDEEQLSYYLKNSKYELGFLINFSAPNLFIKRIIYTNDRKPHLHLIQ